MIINYDVSEKINLFSPSPEGSLPDGQAGKLIFNNPFREWANVENQCPFCFIIKFKTVSNIKIFKLN
jgi:hypothetical protein